MTYFFSKKFFLDLLFPIVCLNCGREGAYLCPTCFQKIKFGKNNYIFSLKYIDDIFIAGDYDEEILMALIKNFKFKGIKEIGKILTEYLTLYWQGRAFLNKNLLSNNNPIIIPLPLAKARLKWRGFNQAEIIATQFAQNFGYDINYGLKKIKNTRPQSGLNAKRRFKNIKNVFKYEGPTLNNRLIILIDDVITTGTTINEAARVLKEAGAKKVIALAVAKG